MAIVIKHVCCLKENNACKPSGPADIVLLFPTLQNFKKLCLVIFGKFLGNRKTPTEKCNILRKVRIKNVISN
jgi:hypothetical protein